MEAYTQFAQVYDSFMDNVPYGEWADFYTKILKGAGIGEGILLDLGCGTGTMTELLADRGYDMIGVDSSEEMLRVATEKREQRSGPAPDILYLKQDMREFELYGTVRGILCVCDSLNYLLEEKEILQTFRLADNYLDPGGLFLFDFNTPYKYGTLIGEATIAENREDCSFIWENYYDGQQQINEYELTVFIRERESGLFSRFTEYHYQRGYTLPVIRRLVEQSGLEFVTALDGDTFTEVTEQSGRIVCVARECKKDKTEPDEKTKKGLV